MSVAFGEPVNTTAEVHTCVQMMAQGLMGVSKQASEGGLLHAFRLADGEPGT